MSLSAIETVLNSCLSEDNEIRRQAEDQLSASIDQNPGEATTLLAKALLSQNITIRELAAVLLRKKLVSDNEKFETVDWNLRKELMSLVLQRVEEEEVDRARKKLGDLIVELATAVKGKWPNLQNTLLSLVDKQNPSQKTCLYILGELVESIQLAAADIEKFIKIAGHNFSNPDSETQMEALLMFGKCICFLDVKFLPKYRSVIPNIIQLLSNLLQKQDELNGQKVLQVLVDIASVNPHFFRQHINEITNLCLALSEQGNLQNDSRILGLEILCSILEKEPQMVRKNKNYIHTTILICLNLMLNIQEDPEWDKTYGDSVDEDECFDAGQVGLNRLSDNINAKKFLPSLMPSIENLMNAEDWRKRHACFVAMAQCCELFRSKRQNKDALFQSIVRGVKDSHYRVRYAAIHCLGIMCSDFKKKFVNTYAGGILDIFEAGMGETDHPRIQAHSAICIVNFAECVSPKLLRPRLEQLLQKLFNLLNQPQKFVQENALGAVSECADNAQKQFVKYYNDFTSHLIRILEQAVGKDYISLRLEALRCLTYIGVAVGSETFQKHAMRAFQISLQMIEQEGVEVIRVLSSWRRIFETCQDEVSDFIEQVSQICLKYASQDVRLVDWETDDEDVDVNNRQIAVNASRLEEKVTAISLIYTITKYSHGHATPIVERAAEILLNLIDNHVDDSVLEAVVEALPGLVICLFDAMSSDMGGVTNENVMCVFNMILQKVIKRMPVEKSSDILFSCTTCIETCITINEELTKTMPEAMLTQLYNELLSCLKKSAMRMDARNLEMKQEDRDDEDIEKLEEENDQEALLSSHISEAVGALVKVYRDDFLPVLSTEYDTLNAMLSADVLDIQRRAALNIFSDVVKHCSNKVLQERLDFFLGHFKKAAGNTSDVYVRETGIFSLGLLYEKSAGAVSAVLPPNEVLSLCFAQFSNGDSVEDLDAVQDHAAMTVGRICKFCGSEINLNEIYTRWLSCFPIRGEEECAQWCYSEMIRLIGENNSVIGSKLPIVIHWIAEVAYTDMSNEALDQSLLDLINKVKSNQSIMSSIVEELPQHLKEKLQQNTT